MKKLTINDFTAMQLFEYADKIEIANTHKNWGVPTHREKTEEEIWDSLFGQAFGFDWRDSEIFQVLRTEYIPKVMDIIDHQFCEGYVTCMQK